MDLVEFVVSLLMLVASRSQLLHMLAIEILLHMRDDLSRLADTRVVRVSHHGGHIRARIEPDVPRFELCHLAHMVNDHMLPIQILFDGTESHELRPV